MRDLEHFRQFREEHNNVPRTARTLRLRAGDVWYCETSPGHWAVSFYPHRADHPFYPADVVTLAPDDLGAEVGEETFAAWLQQRYGKLDPRELITVYIEEGASRQDVEALQAVFDEFEVPAVVRPAYARHGAGSHSWLVLIEAAGALFASGALAKAGADAWDTLSSLMSRIYATRNESGERGTVVLLVGDVRLTWPENPDADLDDWIESSLEDEVEQ